MSPPVKIFAEEGRRTNQTIARFGSKLHSIKSRYTEQKEKALANGKLRATRNILPFIEIPASKNSVCLSPLRKRAHGSSLDDSQASKNLIVRSKDPKYERTPPLAIGSVSIESVASSDQSRSSHVRSRIILQQTLQLFEKNLHIAVIKEFFQESFIICGTDVLSGQRYELQIALDEIVNILGGIVPVNLMEEEGVWLAILPKVTLRPVLKFSNLEFETERKRTIAGAQSFDAYENCHEMLPDNGNQYGEQAENACPNLPRVSRRASISSVESSTGFCNPSSSSPQHDIDQITYRTKILNGSSIPPRSNNISFSVEKEVKYHTTEQPSGRANHDGDADDDTNYGYYDGATLEETYCRDLSRNEVFRSHEACDELQARVMNSANGLQLHQPVTKVKSLTGCKLLSFFKINIEFKHLISFMIFLAVYFAGQC